MVTYKHKCEYPGCSDSFKGVGKYCDQHSATRVKANNPHGFNKHIKNPDPKPEALTQEEQFLLLHHTEQKKQIQELGNKIWREGKELRTLKQKFAMMQKAYFGFKWEE